MSRISAVCTCAAMLAWSVNATADFKSEYFDKLFEKDIERLGNVDDVLYIKETMGLSRTEYYEKSASIELDNGERVFVLNHIPLSEIQRRQAGDSALANATPEQLERAADDIERISREAEEGVQQEIQESGFPPGLANFFMSGGDDPRTPRDEDQIWLSAKPTDVGRMYGMALRGAAAGQRLEEQMDAEERAAFNERRQIATLMQHAGPINLNGRPAERFVADDLNMTQVADGMTFRTNSMEFIGDAEHHVPLMIRIEGEVSDGNETRPIRIEQEQRDYRRVDGCGAMYQPFQSVMRISGIMTPEQEAEMAEAQAQLVEFEKQMAQMPKAQRDMIMRQMGPQMKMMENMTRTGGIEMVENVVDMRCNGGLPDPLQLAQVTMGGGMMANMGGGDAPNRERPYYVNDDGIGVIRFADSSGSSGEFFLDVKRVAGGQEQVLAGGMGPYTGPDIGIYIGSLKMMGVPFDELELELYQQEPRRTAVRFHPEINPGRAESREDCGTLSPTGQCSN